jgi:hypothetical protein
MQVRIGTDFINFGDYGCATDDSYYKDTLALALVSSTLRTWGSFCVLLNTGLSREVLTD